MRIITFSCIMGLFLLIIPIKSFCQVEIRNVGGQNGTINDWFYLETPLPQSPASWIHRSSVMWDMDTYYEGSLGVWYYVGLSSPTKVSVKATFQNEDAFPVVLILPTGNAHDSIMPLILDDTYVKQMDTQDFVVIVFPFPIEYKGYAFSEDFDLWDKIVPDPGMLLVNIAGNMEDDLPTPTGSKLQYEYDKSGNMISRQFITLGSRSLKNALATNQISGPLSDNTINVKIYPNPTKDYVKVEIPDGDNSACEVSVYNLSGKKLHSSTKSGGYFDLDFTQYSNGIYILQINKNGKKSAWRILKTN